MKKATWLLITALLIYSIFCDENILSKFHQNTFKIKDYRVELNRYNEKYFNFFKLKTFKYNRTTPVVNATINMKITVQDKLEIVVQTYKFLSNEYRRFPVRVQLNLKKCFDANAIGFQTIINCGNLTNVYLEKDVTYYTCNFAIDETKFPPLVPNGKFRLNIKFMYLNEEICLLYVFGEVYTPIEYPQK